MLIDPEIDPLAAIRAELDRHRATHRRGRFPERLWQQAVEFAREHGVERVACDLGLDEYGLRRRMTAISSPTQPVPTSSDCQTFVDALISSITGASPSSPSKTMVSLRQAC